MDLPIILNFALGGLVIGAVAVIVILHRKLQESEKENSDQQDLLERESWSLINIRADLQSFVRLIQMIHDNPLEQGGRALVVRSEGAMSQSAKVEFGGKEFTFKTEGIATVVELVLKILGLSVSKN